jgi:hypothetical protein
MRGHRHDVVRLDIRFAILLEEANRIPSHALAHLALETIRLLDKVADRPALNSIARPDLHFRARIENIDAILLCRDFPCEGFRMPAR